MKDFIHEHKFITVFFLHFMIAFCVFTPFLIKNHGILVISNDFNAQELSLNMLANNAVRSGEILWNWKLDIGSDFLTSLSFYNLGSPFFWISLLFPPSFFPFITGWIYMLKYALAGLFSFRWIRRQTEGDLAALTGSILYAFSGFQSCNLVFYHFHDVVAFFPLLLIGLDRLVQDNKRGALLFASALNALLNYYFFVGEVIFLVLYYLVRYSIPLSRERFRTFLKRTSICILEGILGVGIAGILFFPSVMSIINNPRVSVHLNISDYLLFDQQNYLQMLRALFFPAEAMNGMSAIMPENWYSIALYLPFTGFMPTLAYLLKRGMTWLKAMLLLCALLIAIPLLNNAFVLFTPEPSRRWYYMPLLLFALATSLVMEKRELYPIKTAGFICLFLITGSITIVLKNDTWLLKPILFFLISVVGIFGFLASWLLMKTGVPHISMRLICTGAALFAAGTTFCSVFVYRTNYAAICGILPEHAYDNLIGTGLPLADDLPYRYHFWDHYDNRGMAAYISERNSFISTLSPSLFTFYDDLGFPRHNQSPDGPDGTNELLGVRYLITLQEDPDRTLAKTYSNGLWNILIYENNPALPIAFAYDTYMKYDHFLSLDPSSRALAMLKALVVKPEDEATVAETLSLLPDDTDALALPKEKPALVQKRAEMSVQNLAFTTDSVSGYYHPLSDCYVFFSIPYDKNWHAYVNGEEVSTLNINGLTAFHVNAGENNLLLLYRPIERSIGMVFTVLSLLASCGYLTYYRQILKQIPKKRNKH